MSELAMQLDTQQRQFALALQDATQSAQAAALFTSEDAVVQRRLAIYRGTIVAAIGKALALAYPVIQQVVGEEFFNGLARAYWQKTPSNSGDLHDYGASFGDFLATFEHTQEFPYLPDLARLEWAVQHAANAADPQAFDPSVLASVPEEQQAGLRFDFQPGTTIVPSIYPIVQIWTIHQPGYADVFKVDWDLQQTALVMREDMRVTVTALDAGQAAVIEALVSGQTLIAALETAEHVDADFDVQSALAQWLSSGWIKACRID